MLRYASGVRRAVYWSGDSIQALRDGTVGDGKGERGYLDGSIRPAAETGNEGSKGLDQMNITARDYPSSCVTEMLCNGAQVLQEESRTSGATNKVSGV